MWLQEPEAKAFLTQVFWFLGFALLTKDLVLERHAPPPSDSDSPSNDSIICMERHDPRMRIRMMKMMSDENDDDDSYKEGMYPPI